MFLKIAARTIEAGDILIFSQGFGVLEAHFLIKKFFYKKRRVFDFIGHFQS